MTTPNANDLLMGGGVKSCKFETLGQTWIGTILDEPKVQQMKKFGTNELDWWPSGDPKLQLVVLIQTDVRDDAEDDGRRNLFIPPRMMPPVREAIQRAGAKGLAVGGRIAVQWVSGTGLGEGNPKVYAADHQPPQVDPGSLLAGGNGQPAAAAPPPAAAPPAATTAPPPAAPAAGGGLLNPPATAAPPTAPPAAAPPAAAATAPAAGGGLLNTPAAADPATAPPPPGVDPAVWETLPAQQRAAVLAAMGNTGAFTPAAPF